MVESREAYREECGIVFGDWMLGKMLAVCGHGMTGGKSSTYQWLSRSYSNGQWRVGGNQPSVYSLDVNGVMRCKSSRTDAEYRAGKQESSSY